MRYFLNIGRAVAVVVAALQVSSALAQSRFLAVANSGNNGDSRRSVMYFDADDFDAGPLFGVFIGFEEAPSNFDEMSSITVDPKTGDIYIVSFDSGGAVVPNIPMTDTEGDLDIYKIPFATTFYNWQVTYQNQDVRLDPPGPAGPLVGGVAPTVNDAGLGPGSVNGFPGSGASWANSTNLDYVTFGRSHDAGFPSGSLFLSTHANTAVLPGSIVKVGEIKRNNNSDFFSQSLEFLDEDTMFLLENSIAPGATDTAPTDHIFRLLDRVSPNSGVASNYTGNDFFDGGFNRNTADSWESIRAGLVNLDFDPNSGLPLGHSEPESTAYYNNGSGVRGVWVTENDGSGDDLAFYDLNASSLSDHTAGNVGTTVYRPLVSSSGFTGTSLGIYNNPADFADPNAGAPDGKIDKIFVDKNGDLIVVESGFLDSDPNNPIGPDHQPAVYRLPITTYDNGSGEIVFGTPGPKFSLEDDAGFLTTPGEDPAFLKRGIWSAFDSNTNTVYFANPGSAFDGDPNNIEAPYFGMDIHSINVDTGVVTSHLDLDESINLFLGDSAGDYVEFFNVLPGDFDYDGEVDGEDFLLWQRDGSPNGATAAGRALDLAVWEKNYGLVFGDPTPPLVASAAAVPEPTSALILGVGLMLMPTLRRKRAA